MKMGFRGSRLSSIAVSTSSVAWFHRAVIASWRSSMVRRPMSYSSWIAETCSSNEARISGLLGGTTTSFLETVMPACVA